MNCCVVAPRPTPHMRQSVQPSGAPAVMNTSTGPPTTKWQLRQTHCPRHPQHSSSTISAPKHKRQSSHGYSSMSRLANASIGLIIDDLARQVAPRAAASEAVSKHDKSEARRNSMCKGHQVRVKGQTQVRASTTSPRLGPKWLLDCSVWYCPPHSVR